jgi:hypothetical protein
MPHTKAGALIVPIAEAIGPCVPIKFLLGRKPVCP